MLIPELREKPNIVVTRAQLTPEDEKKQVSLLATHATGHMKARLAEITTGAFDPALAGPAKPGKFGAFKTADQASLHLTEVAKTHLYAPRRLLSLAIQPGDYVQAPPYDTDWVEGVGTPFARLDGKLEGEAALPAFGARVHAHFHEAFAYRSFVTKAREVSYGIKHALCVFHASSAASMGYEM